jgi:hypothetical protein
VKFKIELILCRFWLRWERLRFKVYHDRMFDAQANIVNLESIERKLIEMESK